MPRKRKNRYPPKRGMQKPTLYLLVSMGVLILVFIGAGIKFLPPLIEKLTPTPTPGPLTAVIVDQLSKGYPNPEFVEEATALLEGAGYAVSYISNPEVTVEFFRNLPAQGHDIILLRAHSTASYRGPDGEVYSDGTVIISTGESLSDQYPKERNANRLVGFLEDGEEEPVLAVRWDFMEHDAKGRFDNSLIVMMGCDSLRKGQAARVMVNKGASSVIGWTGLVSVDHTDKATLFLLRQILVEEQPISQAIKEMQTVIGPDPVYDSRMLLVSAQP